MKKLGLLILGCIVFMTCKNEEKGDEIRSEEGIVAVKEEVKQITDSDWEILYDGTNLDKWRGYNNPELFSNWTIEEDGSMKFTPGEEGGKNIMTKNKYKNFVLSLEWKISEKGNSGIIWGVFEDPDKKEPYAYGPEIQVLDNERHPDSFVAEGTHKAGSLYDMIKCSPELVKPALEWNHVVLTVDHTKNFGSVMMNGEEAFTFPVHGEEWDAMVKNSKFKNWERFGEYQEGHISLQDHSDIVWYRNIKIKRL